MNLLNHLPEKTAYVPTIAATPPKRKRKWLFWLLGVLLLLMLSVAGVASYAAWAVFTPVSVIDDSDGTFIIAKGEGVRQIAAKLSDSGYIRRPEPFVYYVYYKKEASSLQAGEYAIRRDMNIPQILENFVSGNVVPDEIMVTFPEGYTVRDMDRVLVEKKMLKSGEFKKVAEEWEGYLFPDTYNFRNHAGAVEIRDAMLANFKRKFTEQMKQDAAQLLEKISLQGGAYALSKKSPREGDTMVTLASIIEKEVRSVDEMKTVAGILWKRIEIGMPLQVDASIVYLTGKKTGEITYDDLKVVSPYNTYLNRGLPPGPIANAGLQALMAAIYPIESDYLFYLSKPTGETVFSKTLEEHNIAKAKYLR